MVQFQRKQDFVGVFVVLLLNDLINNSSRDSQIDLGSQVLVSHPRYPCKVQGSELDRIQGSGFRAQGLGCRLQGSGFSVLCEGFKVQGSGFIV